MEEKYFWNRIRTDAGLQFFMLIVVVVLFTFLVRSYHIPDDLENIWKKWAVIGDSFGSINAIFSGLGIIGLLYTIRQQKIDTKNQLKIQQAQFNKQQVATQEQLKLQKVDIELDILSKDENNFLMIEKDYLSIEYLIHAIISDMSTEIKMFTSIKIERKKKKFEKVNLASVLHSHLKTLVIDFGSINILNTFLLFNTKNKHQKTYQLINSLEELNSYISQIKERKDEYRINLKLLGNQIEKLTYKIESSIIKYLRKLYSDYENQNLKICEILECDLKEYKNYILLNHIQNCLVLREDIRIKLKLISQKENEKKDDLKHLQPDYLIVNEKIKLLKTCKKIVDENIPNHISAEERLIKLYERYEKLILKLQQSDYLLHDDNLFKIMSNAEKLLNHQKEVVSLNNSLLHNIESLLGFAEPPFELLQKVFQELKDETSRHITIKKEEIHTKKELLEKKRL